MPWGVKKGQGPIILAMFQLKKINRLMVSYSPVYYYIYMKRKMKNFKGMTILNC